jgi:hypothetical protein
VNIFRFRDRAGILDERSQGFLMTVAWLGGHVTPEQARELGIRNSVPRVHGQLKDLESWGFIKRISTYPAVYQVTKSVTRLLGADLSARREHTIDAIRNQLLTANFYLEAIFWPVEFRVRTQSRTSPNLVNSVVSLPCCIAAASCISGRTSSSNVRPENSPSRWLSASAARSRESLKTLTGGTRLGTPRFRPTVTTSSAAATG